MGMGAPVVPGASAFMHALPPQAVHAAPGYQNQTAFSPSLANRTMNLMKDTGNRFMHFIGRSLDSFMNPFGGFEMASLAGAGILFPVPSSDFKAPERMTRPHIMQFSAMGSGGGDGASRIESLKGDFFKHLREKKYKDTGVIGKAFDVLRSLKDGQQERNLKVGLRMIGWNASADSVAAALLNGSSPAARKRKVFAIARTILSDAEGLDAQRCDCSDIQQVSYLRSLMFLLTENHESILLLAAADYIALEDVPTAEMQTGTYEEFRANRAFFVTSWILKYLNYSTDGGRLEDLGLLHMNPALYQAVEERLAKSVGMNRAESLKKLKSIADEQNMLLEMYGLSHEIKYRMKGTASAKKKQDRFDSDVADANGMRVILTSNRAEDCYAALFAMRDNFKLSGWEEILEEYDDYIARPKANGYQSIHVYFKDPSGYVVEFQIRTEAMDVEAEIGAASHGLYKTGETPEVIHVHTDNIAKGMFESKRDSMIGNGVYFVYDGGYEGIVKLVTGSSKRGPTLLDFAFTRGLKKGLHASSGHIDGKHASIQAGLPMASRVSVRTGVKVHTTGRLKYAATPLARAVLSSPPETISELAEGTLDMEKLIRRGKVEFSRIVSEIMEEMRAYNRHFKIGPPTMKFSMERLYRRMGFDSMDALLSVLAALTHDRNKDQFVDQIKERIRNNVILISQRIDQGYGEMEVMSISDPDALGELITYMDKNWVGLRSLNHSQIASTPFQMSRVTFAYGYKSNAIAYVRGLEDLYRYTFEWPVLSPKAIEVTIRIRKRFDKSEIAREIIGTILKAGVGIKDCTIPKAGANQDVEYNLHVRLPIGRGQRDRLRRLISELERIKGVGGIVAL